MFLTEIGQFQPRTYILEWPVDTLSLLVIQKLSINGNVATFMLHSKRYRWFFSMMCVFSRCFDLVWSVCFSWLKIGGRLCFRHWAKQEGRLSVTWQWVTTMLMSMQQPSMVLLLEILLWVLFFRVYELQLDNLPPCSVMVQLVFSILTF